MHHSYLNVNDALPDLAGYVLGGDEVGSRDGSRVKERLHETVTLTEPWSRYMLLPQRKASLPAQIAETMWVLSGRDDVKWLSNYLPRAGQFSDDGKVWRGAYGPRLRAFGRTTGSPESGVDQLAHVVELLKRDPLTRRAVIGIYDGAIDARPGKDVPCNDTITFQSRLGKLHMHVFVRSNDLVWGWSGINTFEWSVLQEVIASILGIGVGYLTFATSSLHIYDRHWKRMRELHEAYSDVSETPWGDFDAPGLDGAIKSVADLDDELTLWFRAEQHIRTTGGFEEALKYINHTEVNPMFRQWLMVIAAWWWDAGAGLIKSNTLKAALYFSPKRKRPTAEKTPAPVEAPKESRGDFVDGVVELHRVKHESYGDSWKKRGETLGILANIARKVDRLGATDQYETAMDTAIDLLVYLVKYRFFLHDLEWSTTFSDGHEWVGEKIRGLLNTARVMDSAIDAESLAERLNAHMLADNWVEGNTIEIRKREVIEASIHAANYVANLWKGQNK